MLRNAELWGGLAWLAVGAFVVWAGLDLGLGSAHEPGSGFALFWIGVLIVTLALVVTVRALLDGGPALAELWSGTRWGKVLLVLALLLVFALLFERVGFIPSTLVLLLVLMRFVDPVDWRIALPVAAGATAGVWVVLTKWLKIQLPAGVLAGWLG